VRIHQNSTKNFRKFRHVFRLSTINIELTINPLLHWHITKISITVFIKLHFYNTIGKINDLNKRTSMDSFHLKLQGLSFLFLVLWFLGTLAILLQTCFSENQPEFHLSLPYLSVLRKKFHQPSYQILVPSCYPL